VSRSPEPPRCERTLPGVWRLRLSLPWPGVPHGNAWAVAADGGIVLFDTGRGDPARLRELDLALAGAGFGVEDIRLLICTHSHADHYGLAAEITAVAGCELWMHPAWGHIREMADEPLLAYEHRAVRARENGVPEAVIERHREAVEADPRNGFGPLREPDCELVTGVEVETDVGTWRVLETPGHDPAHVILHQPGSGLAITGDHLLGRVVLHFDYGNSPDPVAEYLTSLAATEALGIELCLAGHGRTFRDPVGKIEETRGAIASTRRQIAELLAARPRTAFELLAEIRGEEFAAHPATVYEISLFLAFLDTMAATGETIPVADIAVRQWRLTTAGAAAVAA
jgi:glyoxylase-like metal-dependent hydrolase (beta-lactamase superfamily II)